jgi:hypothetical protein
MNFLAPWFLIGALAVAGPVLFHLIRRSARERMPFSSLLLLRPTPPRATRRRKLEHIVLLLLRCLCVLLLAACFARPFFSKAVFTPPAAAEGRQIVLLLDTSASMRRADLWAAARAVAARYLEKTTPADRLAIMTFDQQPRTLVSFADWSAWPMDQRAALARQRVDAVSPGWGGTHFGTALTTAAEQFSEEAARPNAAAQRDLVLISDLQEGAKLDGLQGHDWPNGVGVIIEKVEPKRAGNAGISIQSQTAAGAGSGREARARITNSRDSTYEKFLLGWSAEGGSDFAGKPVDIYLPPGQSRVFAAPDLPAGAVSGALRLTGDDEKFDNTAWFAAAEPEQVAIAYLGADAANDPEHMRYYLQRAFPDTARRRVEVVSAITNSVVSPEALNRASLAVIPSSLGIDDAKIARDWLAGGKTALLVLAGAQSTATLAALTGRSDVEITEASGEYALLGEIDFSHPIFAPFADPRFSDFSRIHFWRHRRWTISPGDSVRVLARFDDGAPALGQIAVGKGNLLVLCAGWNPADSQLALSSKFLPLLQTILDWSGGAAPLRSQFVIGESIPSPVSAGDAPQWRKPDGKSVAVPAGTAFTDTDIPGIYSVTAGAKTQRFAVNLPLEESRTAPLSLDDLARLGVPLRNEKMFPIATTPGAQRHLQDAELEGRQKLWRWLLVALLAAALIEIVLGGWLARRVKTLEVAA